MGMVVIGLYCMVFYLVLIIPFSVLQTDGFLGGFCGDGQGAVHGDSFLPSLLLWSGSEYLSFTTAWFLFWCSGLSRPRHKIVTTCRWGIRRSGGRSVSYIGGHGECCIWAMSVI